MSVTKTPNGFTLDTAGQLAAERLGHEGLEDARAALEGGRQVVQPDG